jgi:hypothetical protein
VLFHFSPEPHDHAQVLSPPISGHQEQLILPLPQITTVTNRGILLQRFEHVDDVEFVTH